MCFHACSIFYEDRLLTFSTSVRANSDNIISQQDVCLSVCMHLHSYSFEDKFVQERGVARLWEVGKLQGSISYFLATRSSQMNAEAASDVDPKY